MRVASLPPELWRFILRYATYSPLCLYSSDNWTKSETIEGCLSPSYECLKSQNPLTPITYFRDRDLHNIDTMENFAQMRTKRSLSRVCRMFHDLMTEFLFETLYVSTCSSAEQLANLLQFSTKSLGRWTRQLAVVGIFFTPPSSISVYAQSVVRILSQCPNLAACHLRWNSYSRSLRVHEDRIIDALPDTLRHFEWHSAGGGFERLPEMRSFYRLLLRAGGNLQTLKITGYLPVNEENSVPIVEQRISLPRLTHLKVRRAFRDDLALLQSWDVSNTLTCLNIGSMWAYFDNREVSNAFWNTLKPSLRCVHFGESTTMCTQLAHRVLEFAPSLRSMEYYYFGDWDDDTWANVQHDKLESIRMNISHPTISHRSLFNSRRFPRERQWVRLRTHMRFFCHQEGQSLEERTFPSMKKVRLVASAREDDFLQDPTVLAKWLKSVIAEYSASVDVDVELE